MPPATPVSVPSPIPVSAVPASFLEHALNAIEAPSINAANARAGRMSVMCPPPVNRISGRTGGKLHAASVDPAMLNASDKFAPGCGWEYQREARQLHTKGVSCEWQGTSFEREELVWIVFNSFDQPKQHLSDFDGLVDQRNSLVVAERIRVAGGNQVILTFVR
jgi:hypothetical protein